MANVEEIKGLGDGSVCDAVLNGISQGYFHREFQEASYQYQKHIDVGKEVIVEFDEYETEGTRRRHPAGGREDPRTTAGQD